MSEYQLKKLKSCLLPETVSFQMNSNGTESDLLSVRKNIA